MKKVSVRPRLCWWLLGLGIWAGFLAHNDYVIRLLRQGAGAVAYKGSFMKLVQTAPSLPQNSGKNDIPVCECRMEKLSVTRHPQSPELAEYLMRP